jgi:phosphoglycerate dehydrogenase-like enzyme
MAVLILSKPTPPETFARALAELNFPHPVHQSLDGVDPASIRWLVAWRLRDGVLSTLPNLELLFCPAAGADKLLATADLPATLPIGRVSDDAQSLELAQYVVHAALDHLRIAPRYRPAKGFKIARMMAKAFTNHFQNTTGRIVDAKTKSIR